MTMTCRCRRITLHFSHIGLTLGRTFTFSSLSRTAQLDTAPAPAVRRRLRCPGLLVTVGDPPPSQVVGGDLHLHLVPGKDADAPHLSGAVGQHFVAILELHPEHGVGQRLNDHSLEHDGIFLRLGQVNLLDILLFSYHVGPVVDVRHDHVVVAVSAPHSEAHRRSATLSGTGTPQHTRGQPNDQSSPSGPNCQSDPCSAARPTRRWPGRRRPRGPEGGGQRTVNTSGPSSVTAMVCSKWADSRPSAVTTLHPSSRSRVAGPPALTIGSMAKTMPDRRVGPGVPGQ